MLIFYIILAAVFLPLGGLKMQALWKNQLGDVYSVGLGSSACVGAAIAAWKGFDIKLGAYFACLCCTIITSVVCKFVSTRRFITFGLIFGSMIGSFGVIAANNANPEQLQQYYRWTSVSFTTFEYSSIVIISLMTLIVGVSCLLNKRDLISYIGVCLVTTAIISVIGIVGMISLTIPNVAKLITEDSKKYTIISIGLSLTVMFITFIIVNYVKAIYLPASATMSLIMTPLLWFTLQRSN